MNREEFNDAMCRLRQAEEEFNKKLQEAFKPFIDKMNEGAEEEFNKKLQEAFKPFIDKMNEANEPELCIGDEIEYIKYGKASEKRVVIRIDDREGDEKIIWTIGLDRFDQYGTSTKDPTEKYRKTGKRYDSIPLNTKSK